MLNCIVVFLMGDVFDRLLVGRNEARDRPAVARLARQ